MKHRAFVLLALSATATGQSVTLTALSPITVTASHGLQSQTATLPAGPIAAMPLLTASVNPGPGDIAFAQLAWSVLSSATRMEVVFQQFASLASLGNPAFAHLGPTDWVVELTNPQAMFARIDVVQEGPVPSGPNQQMFVLDSGDDGSNEYSLGSMSTGTVGLLGPTPWRIRIRTDTTLLGPGVVAPRARLVVTPLPGIATASVVGNCDPSRWLTAVPTFTADLRFEMGFDGFGAPFVLVLGLSAQPIVVNAAPPMPCLLVSSPDVLVFMPVWSPEYVLPLPPSVRPISFFGQAVSLEPTGLVTTNAFFVSAF
ncbi:MAG: hypothetical protein JNK78_07355 [Planctomycetes bacterium]|nr:hypothetical protein [Planctomycetota bacterium]